MLENLIIKIVQDFPQGISQTQIIRFVLESGYQEDSPGLLAFKVREIVSNLARQKQLVKSADQSAFGQVVRPKILRIRK